MGFGEGGLSKAPDGTETELESQEPNTGTKKPTKSQIKRCQQVLDRTLAQISYWNLELSKMGKSVSIWKSITNVKFQPVVAAVSKFNEDVGILLSLLSGGINDPWTFDTTAFKVEFNVAADNYLELQDYIDEIELEHPKRLRPSTSDPFNPPSTASASSSQINGL
jgi:hypothetical protein